jgi:hypothetical protein
VQSILILRGEGKQEERGRRGSARKMEERKERGERERKRRRGRMNTRRNSPKIRP